MNKTPTSVKRSYTTNHVTVFKNNKSNVRVWSGDSNVHSQTQRSSGAGLTNTYRSKAFANRTS